MYQHCTVLSDRFCNQITVEEAANLGVYSRRIASILVIRLAISTNLLHVLLDDFSELAVAMGSVPTGKPDSCIEISFLSGTA